MHTSLIVAAIVWILVAAVFVVFIRGAGSARKRGGK